MDGEWLTYRQAAVRLGVTLEAARRRAMRGNWRRMPDNRGRTLVMVPELPPPDASSDCAPDVTVTELRWQGAESHTASELVSALNAHIETLKAEVEQLGQLSQRDAQLVTERECADRAIAELDRQRVGLYALAQRLAIAETQLADSQARTAAAETKSERAIAELFAVPQRLAIADTERERAEQATAEFTALMRSTAG